MNLTQIGGYPDEVIIPETSSAAADRETGLLAVRLRWCGWCGVVWGAAGGVGWCGMVWGGVGCCGVV